MKKLLSITPHLSTGGAPQVLVKRIELIKDHYEIYVVEYSNISDHFIIQKNRIKKLIDFDKFFTLGNNKMELLNIINRIKPDFIHLEEIPEMFMDYKVAKELYKTNREYKIFETTHSSDFDVNKKLFFPDKFIFVSQFNCFKFNKFGIPTEVVEYPVEKKPRLLSAKRKSMIELGLDPSYKHILNVGLFTPRKNQAYAFDIARKLENEKILLHFVGNQAENFKYYWEPLMKNKPKNCIIWGERDDVEKFYNACDIFLFTSMGFRFDKELNPLVIKEALEIQIPQLLFPLDVYCSKYDNEPLITYLNGDVEKDAELVKNFNDFNFDDEIADIEEVRYPYKNIDVTEEFRKASILDNKIYGIDAQEEIRKMSQTQEYHNNEIKHKVKAIHLLVDTDDRGGKSVQDMSQLSEYGIEYKQHINKKYTEIPPKETSARPNDVNRLGAYGLNGPHYGNYLAFKRAIEEEFSDDLDFLILMEGDCVINKNIDIEFFMKRLNEAFDIMNKNDITYLSFGENYNIKTKKLISDKIEIIPEVDWLYITDKIIQIQFIIFSKSIRNFLLNTYKNMPWDVSDLYFNLIFSGTPHKMAIVNKPLANQLDGESNIDGLIEKSDDIIMKFDPNENKIKMCLDNPYNPREKEFKVDVKDQSNNSLYKGNIKISTNYETWIKISTDNVKYVNVSFSSNEKEMKKRIIFNGSMYTIENDEINMDKPLKDISKIKSDNDDDIYIISTYPNSSIKYEITKKCIQSLKKDGKKIMISSHMPLSEELQEMVDYYVYDGFNPLIKHTLYNNYWYDTSDFRAEVLFETLSKNNNLNQSLTCLNNIENSISLAKSLGYKRVINVTYDYIFSESDIKTINNLLNRIENENKEGYFMQFSDNDFDTLKSVFFIINTDTYKEIFTNPRTPEKYNQECSNMNCDNFLERYFYKKLENYKDRLIIDHTTEEKLFNGEINIFSGVEYLTYLPVENQKNKFALWLSTNNTKDDRKIVVNKIVNNNITDTYEKDIKNRSFFYKIINIKEGDDIIIETKIIDNITNETLDCEKFGTINHYNFDDMLKDRGLFKVKNPDILKNDDDYMGVKMASVINYKTEDYDNIKNCIDSVDDISTMINVSISDHKYNGDEENPDITKRTYDELHKDGDKLNFIQYEFDKSINADEKYWKNVSRYLGSKYLKGDYDWILFIDSDETLLIDNFKKFINNSLDKNAYLFSNMDSPMLIKKDFLSFTGDRFDIVNRIKNNMIDTEKEIGLKLFEKK
jgi:hypothetical protein